MTGSLPGGEGSLLSSCSLPLADLVAVAAVDGRRRIIRRATSGQTTMMSSMETSGADACGSISSWRTWRSGCNT